MNINDNVELRLILSAIYTMIEVLRRGDTVLHGDCLGKLKSVIEMSQADKERMQTLRVQFVTELGRAKFAYD